MTYIYTYLYLYRLVATLSAIIEVAARSHDRILQETSTGGKEVYIYIYIDYGGCVMCMYEGYMCIMYVCIICIKDVCVYAVCMVCVVENTGIYIRGIVCIYNELFIIHNILNKPIHTYIYM